MMTAGEWGFAAHGKKKRQPGRETLRNCAIGQRRAHARAGAPARSIDLRRPHPEMFRGDRLRKRRKLRHIAQALGRA
jgi:hypothetical protein